MSDEYMDVWRRQQIQDKNDALCRLRKEKGGPVHHDASSLVHLRAVKAAAQAVLDAVDSYGFVGAHSFQISQLRDVLWDDQE